MATKLASERASDQVVRWRYEQLTASGFTSALAAAVAEDPRYDLHALIQLCECGCAHDLAVRILAPLDGEIAA